MTLFKGCKPFVIDKRDFLHVKYRVESEIVEPTVPFGLDELQKYEGVEGDMFGNGPDDTVSPGFQGCGDCVWACFGHALKLWKAEAGQPINITGKEIVAAYSDCTGYNPDDPNSDQGTDMRTALLYWQKTGITDADGIVHKIGPFTLLDATKLDGNNYPYEILEALNIYDAVMVAINFPDYAMDEFNEGLPWTLQANGTDDGGHAICQLIAFDGTYFYFETWAKVIKVHKDFLAAQINQAWGVLDSEMLNSQGVSIKGLDLAQLTADLQDIVNGTVPEPVVTPIDVTTILKKLNKANTLISEAVIDIKNLDNQNEKEKKEETDLRTKWDQIKEIVIT